MKNVSYIYDCIIHVYETTELERTVASVREGRPGKW